MPTHSIQTKLPYTTDQLFDLVADIESYPKFLPWCEAARINERDGDIVFADLAVHFRGVGGKYTSRVELNRKDMEINVELAQGPFHHLNQAWKFYKDSEGARVEFDIDFKLRSFLMEKVMDLMFDDACKKMIQAFEERAHKLYG